MRLAQIILPSAVTGGTVLPSVHQALMEELVEQFGGYTMVHGRGAWAAPSGAVIREPVCIYHVAAEDNVHSIAVLRAIAQVAGRAGKQQSVMIVLPAGDVEFLEIA
jgi:hypothetical protein